MNKLTQCPAAAIFSPTALAASATAPGILCTVSTT